MKKFKFSKAYIWVFLYRFAFLLFVPFFQLLIFGGEGLNTLFTLYSADLMTAVGIIAVAFIRCSKARLVIIERRLFISQGFIMKTCDVLPKGTSANRTLTRTFALRFFRCSALRFSPYVLSACGYLRKQDACEFMENDNEDNKCISFKSGIFRNVLMSAVFSNALTGLLAASPLIRRAATVMGARQSALILNGANPEHLPFIRDLPPVLSKISSVLFFCWTIGFFTEFFREYQLKLELSGNKVTVSKGLVTKYIAAFDKSSVKSFESRQSIMLFILGLRSARVAVNLKPHSKIHILSAATSSKTIEVRDLFFERNQSPKALLYPEKNALRSYVMLPFVCMALSGFAAVFIRSPLWKIAAAFIIFVCFLWYIFRIFAFFRSSLYICGELWEISYFDRLNFTNTTFLEKNITSFTLSRSIIGRISGRCNLSVYLAHNKKLKVKIKHLDFEEVQKLLTI